MDHSQKDHDVGYKRPPRSRQFKKGQSGNPGGRRRKSGPIRVDAQGIFDETFQVSVAGQVRTMSAKEVEIRQILKKAAEKKDFRSMAYLLGLFEPYQDLATFTHHTALIWLAVGLGGLIFRNVQLFFLKDVQTGLVWATKIITDPFHDIKLYHKSPLYLMRGELFDVPQKQHG